MKKYDVLYNSLIVTCIATLLICGVFYYQKGGFKITQTGKYDSFAQVMKLVDDNYVDSTNLAAINSFAISQVLASLDPFSKYLDKNASLNSKSKLEGKFEGIGIEFSILQDTISIVSPLDGGPAAKGGLQSGDKIVKIDDKLVIGNHLSDDLVKAKLKGEKGTNVKLGVLRGGNPNLLSFNIVRDRIPLFSINSAYMITPETGFIKINSFTEKTHEDFVKSVEVLKKQGMKQLILDLRNNPGGYVNSAIQVLDELIDGKKLLAYTDGKNDEFDEKFFAQVNGKFEQGKIAVLINQNTASAAEIVAGSLQDNDRALIIGTKSFGKGLVQLPINMPDGSELRLTVSRYYIPSGRNIQKSYHSQQDSLSFVKTVKTRVYKTIGGRKVDNLGGISPEVFAVNDSTAITPLLQDLMRRGIMKTVAYQYVRNNRPRLSTYQFDDFNRDFVIDKTFIKEIKKIAQEEKIAINQKDFALSENLIKLQIKAYIARALWNKNIKDGIENEYFKVIHPSDEVIQKALVSINKVNILK
jgi:carboxyl-terminal processing protease